MRTREVRVVDGLKSVMRMLLKPLLMEELSDQLSEAHADAIVASLCERLETCLLQDLQFSNLLHEGDVWQNEELNVPTIIQAIKDAAARQDRAGAAHALEAVAQHLEHVANTSRLKGVIRGGI